MAHEVWYKYRLIFHLHVYVLLVFKTRSTSGAIRAGQPECVVGRANYKPVAAALVASSEQRVESAVQKQRKSQQQRRLDQHQQRREAAGTTNSTHI